jgi:hypothetical protein
MNVQRYFRENWDAPFVIAFMVLLTVSAVELSFRLSDSPGALRRLQGRVRLCFSERDRGEEEDCVDASVVIDTVLL